MRHVMVDIETLGKRPGSVILSIGACRFDESGIGSAFYRPIDVFDSLMRGLTVDEETVAWWRERPAEVRGALKPALPVIDTLVEFTAFVKSPDDIGHTLLWAKGPDFDLVMIEAALTQLGMRKPWSYRATRDVRTILALAPGVIPATANNNKHHALDDAVYQAHQVIAAANQIRFPLSEMV